MSSRVDAVIQEFSTKLQAAIREEFAAEVTAAIQMALGSASERRTAGVRTARTGSSKRKTKRNGGPRTPEQVAQYCEDLLAYISNNPGVRSEQIAEATKVTTGELALPLKRLVAEKRLKSAGKARGTVYTVAQSSVV